MSIPSRQLQFLKLYKNILRIHRKKLNFEMRSLGDSYVKEEFKAHLKKEKQLSQRQLSLFFQNWQTYLLTLEKQDEIIGKELEEQQLQILNEDQLHKLNQLQQQISLNNEPFS
eukprot:TRINITY_DN389_c1_g1_i2.p1 TRINITY_DN389_c1_g1~~TRINITY_DN389_c1_g1_i2.p1  ORF type:complete len:113 (-),score=47.21 TRINITY_DN389_c1_g1_i2:74-412(-)